MSQIVEVLAFISLSMMCEGEGINLRKKGIQLEELSANILSLKSFSISIKNYSTATF